MKVFETIKTAREHVHSLFNQQLTVGFVPTMGALHEGHLSLVKRAVRENDRVAVSIFVNPIQFNNPADLEKYPRNLKTDLGLLEPLLHDDDYVFAPSVAEMYPKPETHVYDFGALASVMEGRFRPGHFNGVGVVVNKLLRIIEPAAAYFGEKDFQQLAIIRRLVAIEQLRVTIIPCPIIREPDGLAMSSRNVRLTPEHRRTAPLIFQTLTRAAGKITSAGPDQLRQFIISTLNQTGLLEVEYLEFADETTLTPVASWSDSANIRCYIAVQAGEVRLIDNMRM
ncbi:MAG: pantoate--beta-alanine ligase [Bacteroidia bacterium]|nr:pantoate--beta-alanine ligase [Bacteroidia bacterium]